MNRNVLIIAAVIAVVAVAAVAAFFLLSGPKWDEPVDKWVLDQDVYEGDYIEYSDRYTVVSIDGNTCEVRKNDEDATQTMSKQDFLRLLSAKGQMDQFFSGYRYTMSVHYDKDDSYGVTKNFEGDVRTDKFGLMDDYDIELYVGSHNILGSWELEDFGHYNLRSNLSFING